LHYLTLNRKAGTLSGGEAQRIRLASQVGTRLVGALYVLDEPTIGLHQKDNDQLVKTLRSLCDIGNTIIVVEHDEDTILASDWIVDIGPRAGVHGGEIIYSGPLDIMFTGTQLNLEKVKHFKIKSIDSSQMETLFRSAQDNIVRNCKIIGNAEKSLTGKYLRRELKIELPIKRRKVDRTTAKLKIKGATEHNLKNINVEIPLRRFVCLTGVSGSGKSTLMNNILYRAVANKLNHTKKRIGKCKEILGIEYLDKIIRIDQSPIGRTPRSNPVTYTGAWTGIRELFASTAEARMRGFKAGRFSFNIPGGRCEHCEGKGNLEIEMHFLPSVQIVCDVCKGKRFNQETLQIHYKGKNIAEILEMTIEEAKSFFEDIPFINDKLKMLNEVGLDYLTLGQSATTLSGGEAQRIKLSKELSKRSTSKTLYLLDEPTTGLHYDDVKKLLEVLDHLVSQGNTVMVIEHNLDVIKCADWIIDLGPEGGDQGGEVVAIGTPEEVARKKGSWTGEYLKKVL
jgi:excinuclease ABC subunit A